MVGIHPSPHFHLQVTWPLLLEHLSSTQEEFLSGAGVAWGPQGVKRSRAQSLTGGDPALIPHQTVKRRKDAEGDEEEDADGDEEPSLGLGKDGVKAKVKVARQTTGKGEDEADEADDEEVLPDEAEAEAGATPGLARYRVQALRERCGGIVWIDIRPQGEAGVHGVQCP